MERAARQFPQPRVSPECYKLFETGGCHNYNHPWPLRDIEQQLSSGWWEIGHDMVLFQRELSIEWCWTLFPFSLSAHVSLYDVRISSHEDIIPDWSWSISSSQVISPHLIITSTSPTSSLPHSLPTPTTMVTELFIWMQSSRVVCCWIYSISVGNAL